MSLLPRFAGIALGLLIALWFTYHVWRALSTGVANVHNKIIRRRGRPVYYWSAVIAQTGFAAMFYAIAAVNISEWIGE